MAWHNLPNGPVITNPLYPMSQWLYFKFSLKKLESWISWKLFFNNFFDLLSNSPFTFKEEFKFVKDFFLVCNNLKCLYNDLYKMKGTDLWKYVSMSYFLCLNSIFDCNLNGYTKKFDVNVLDHTKSIY